jgi:hypothetical protein
MIIKCSPIHTENREFALVHGAVVGFFATPFKNNVTWSMSESTVGIYGVTNAASIVAPPYA